MLGTQNKDIFKAALIVIGNEVLAGRTIDTNSPWIATRLTGHGIVLSEIRVVPDVEDVIIRAVNELRAGYDYVFTTGGIGPTHDDITAASVAKAFGVELINHEVAFRMLEEYYGIEELTPARAKMSLIPQGASLIHNPVSAAPGFNIGNVYVMAGVPRIMQAMLDYVLSTIQAGKPILSNTVTCVLAESVLAQPLEGLQNKYPAIQIGSYPHYRGGALGVSLVLRGTDAQMLEKATAALIELIKSLGDSPRALSMQAVRD